MEILGAGAFINLENREKIEQLKYKNDIDEFMMKFTEFNALAGMSGIILRNKEITSDLSGWALTPMQLRIRQALPCKNHPTV